MLINALSVDKKVKIFRNWLSHGRHTFVISFSISNPKKKINHRLLIIWINDLIRAQTFFQMKMHADIVMIIEWLFLQLIDRDKIN